MKHTYQQTAEQASQTTQVLTLFKEQVIVQQLIFLIDCNISADWNTVYNLAYPNLHCQVPGPNLGHD